MNGMASLLKTMGLDTDKLQADAQMFMQRVSAQIDVLNNRLASIEARQAEILALLRPPPSRAITMDHQAERHPL